MKGKLIFIFIALAFHLGCYKNEDNSNPTVVVKEVVEVYINTTIAGTVIDKSGNLMSDYRLIVNGQTYEVSGVSFAIDLLGAKKNGQLINVWKDDKNISQGIFQLIENDVNSITLRVLEDWDTETIGDSNGSLAGLVSIDWAGSILQASNDTYSGNVALSTRLITQEDAISSIGFSREGALLSLKTYGGFQFELQTTDNIELSSPTKGIKLSFVTVPSGSTSLFYLDAATERLVLIEEEVNTGFPVYVHKGGVYLFAQYKRGVFAQGNLQYEGQKVAFAKIQYSVDNTFIQGITTLEGRWLIVIPQESQGTLISVNNCGIEVSNEVINTSKENISMVDLLISDAKYLYMPNLEISNCDGQIEENPIINIEGPNGQQYHVFTSSLIDPYMLICGESIISGINNVNGQNGQTFSITSPVNVLSNCEDYQDGFLGIDIEGESKNYDQIELMEDNGSLILQSGEHFKIIIKGVDDGVYSDEQINISINDATFGSMGYYLFCLNSTLGCGIESCVINRFDDNGIIWTQLTFKGTLWMETITPKIAGKYDIKGNLLLK